MPNRQRLGYAVLAAVLLILAVTIIARFSGNPGMHPPSELGIHPEILLRQTPADAATMAGETLYEAVRHSVVKINVLIDQALVGHGSGAVLGVDGNGQLYVLTNRHVVYHEVANPPLLSYEIELENGIQLPAMLDFYSRTHDLAVVVAPGLTGWGLPVGLRMCSDLSVGEEVFALGSPIGLDHSFTKGVVSALRWPMIQTDATVHSGSSGGPLFDHSGRVCGVVTTSHMEKDFSFALCGETILEMLDLQSKPGQSFDGVSVLPALQGKAQDRGAIFTYFPHDPPVPDWIPPSVSVHKDHWKLIREFHQGENGAHRYRLFSLKEDISEEKNVAAEHPDLVKELDQLITSFLSDTKAVLPISNPSFNPAKYHPELEGKNRVRQPVKKPTVRQPNAKNTPPKDTPFDPALQGWKARNCTAKVEDGIITLTSDASDPFLGTGATQFKGPSEITFRVRCILGGKGRITWANNTENPQSKPFTIKRGRWHELTVQLPAEGSLGILRLHLPAEEQKVEVDSISLTAGETTKSWTF